MKKAGLSKAGLFAWGYWGWFPLRSGRGSGCYALEIWVLLPWGFVSATPAHLIPFAPLPLRVHSASLNIRYWRKPLCIARANSRSNYLPPNGRVTKNFATFLLQSFALSFQIIESNSFGGA